MTWQFYILQRTDTEQYFAGTLFGEPVWCAEFTDAMPMPTMGTLDRWVERLPKNSYRPIPVDVDNTNGPTRVVGLTMQKGPTP